MVQTHVFHVTLPWSVVRAVLPYQCALIVKKGFSCPEIIVVHAFLPLRDACDVLTVLTALTVKVVIL